MRGFAYDGPLARALLTVAYIFGVSLSLVACAVPYVLFEQLVGWQPTHLALVIGVLSTLPFGPALFATLSAARDLLDVHGSPGRPSALLVVAVRAAAARPHVALAWLLLVAVTYAVTLIPIIGPSLALFTPAAAACGILIVSRTFGFDEWMLRPATVDAARAS
jgi:hypothetical protein